MSFSAISPERITGNDPPTSVSFNLRQRVSRKLDDYRSLSFGFVRISNQEGELAIGGRCCVLNLPSPQNAEPIFGDEFDRPGLGKRIISLKSLILCRHFFLVRTSPNTNYQRRCKDGVRGS